MSSRFVSYVGLGSLVMLGACSSSEGREPAATTFVPPTTGVATTDADTEATFGVPPITSDDSGNPPNDDTGVMTTAVDDTSATTGDPGGEPFSMSDPLMGGTMGTALGGSFGPDGWTTTDRTDRIYWALPRLGEGSFEFTVTGLTIDVMPLNDHEIFAMYEGGWGIEHPIDYDPEFRVNNYKSMIRIYGQAEIDRVGQVKLMWGMCPQGAPGYGIDTCACGSFFDEPFGGDPTWDGSPQRLRVEWDAIGSRLFRNGELVLDIDASASGLFFGPQALYASLGNPRPINVDSAGMPVGVTFSDVVVEGVTGSEATCG